MAPVSRLPKLPFDHKSIIDLAVSRVRSKSQYSSLPVYLCGEHVTLPRLQAVYEAVLGEPINKVSFRRKMDEMGILEAVRVKWSPGQRIGQRRCTGCEKSSNGNYPLSRGASILDGLDGTPSRGRCIGQITSHRVW